MAWLMGDRSKIRRNVVLAAPGKFPAEMESLHNVAGDVARVQKWVLVAVDEFGEGFYRPVGGGR